MNNPTPKPVQRRTCAQCGAELPTDISSLCPKCLLRQALAAESTKVMPNMVMPSVRVRSGGLPAAGQQFGHYRLGRPLGGGGMGMVFEAEDLDSGRRVALKVLSHALDSPEARERFFREGRLAASINHPNSVYVFGTEEIAGTPVIAMELVPGGTLEQRVQTRGAMPTAEAIDAILQIIAGLEQAQRLGILHRDIKPSNCFLDEDGTVKIGDFGLSICTSLRTEPALTATGTFLGTPAFCAPEQLRGEELNARSDIYAVGATLFYLMTGRTPFQAKNVVALIAAVLEHPAPSPRQFNPTLPVGLDRAVRRCLEKHPQERFKDYHELALALAPYGSSAPTPAPLPLRFFAGLADAVVLGAMSLLTLLVTGLDPMELLNSATQPGWKWAAMVLTGACMSLAYYSVLEGCWGAAVGKALCGLRIIGPQKSAPGWGRALLRALVYVLLPMLPVWLIFGFNPKVYLGKSGLAQFVPSLLFYGMLVVLFCTARKRNGYAALQDLATHTRVIARVCLQPRPVPSAIEVPPTGVESHPRIGPYHVIEPFAGSHTADSGPPTNITEASWFVAYDLRLLRKVWIRTVPTGTPGISTPLRNLGRIGRLRWLTGRRTPEENWDAFEAVSGKPLVSIAADTPRPEWRQVRFWLLDLAQELASAEKDGTLPDDLTLDRVWVTGESRVKLLDFPAPGLRPGSATALTANAPPVLARKVACQRLLGQIANVTLTGSLLSADKSPDELPLPLPVHARNWLKKLAAGLSLDELVLALRPLLSKPTAVTRQRRAVIVAACLLIPLIAVVAAIFGTRLIREWEHRYPGLFDLTVLLQDRWVRQRSTGFVFHFDASGFTKDRGSRTSWGAHSGPSDHDLALFISSRYRSLITNNAAWSSALALSLIKGEGRRFAEQSLLDYPAPSAEEVERVTKLIEPSLPKSGLPDLRKQPFLLVGVFHGVLALYVALPAVLGALLFRRGLILLAAGVTFVRRNGRRASRARLFWRSLITWSLVIPLAAITMESADGHQLWRGLLASVGLMGLTVLSILLPQRGLPDRLAGTFPVPC